MSDQKPSTLPTRKWFATQVTSLSAVVIAWINAGEFNSTVAVAAVGLVAQAVVGYLVPNASTPGGVPLRGNDPGPDRAPVGAN